MANPLRWLDQKNYSSRVESQISHQTEELVSQLNAIKQLSDDLLDLMSLEKISFTKEQFEQLTELAKALPKSPDFPVSLGYYLAEKDNQILFEDWLNYFEKYKACSDMLLNEYHERILNEDFSLWQLEWNKANQSWFLPKWLGKNKVKKHFSVYRKSKLSSDNQVEQLFQLSEELLSYKKVLGQTRFGEITKVLRSWYKEEDTDILYLREANEQLKSLASKFRFLGLHSFEKWIETLSQQGIVQIEVFLNSAKPHFDHFCKEAGKLDELIHAYIQLTGFSVEDSRSAESFFDHLLSKLEGIGKHIPELKTGLIIL